MQNNFIQESVYFKIEVSCFWLGCKWNCCRT